MAKVGRKPDEYITKKGERVPGLIHQKDGRWRVLASGKRFTADSEAEAIAKFHLPAGRETVNVPSHAVMSQQPGHHMWFEKTETTGEAFWPWLRQLLITDLATVAKKTGLPGLATLDLTAIPGKTIRLTDIIDLYETKSESTQNTRGHVASALKKLSHITGATTLPELSTPGLMAFREQIISQLAPTGAIALFGKIKAALAFARKVGGMDAGQIDAALSRMKVLYAPKATTPSTPQPITPDDFRRLLAVANPTWRAIFLASLNMATYLADIATLVWSDFDLNAATYVGIRSKTKIRRVGLLWAETVEALRAIPRTGSPLVFPSRTGIQYRSDSMHKRYATIRDAAGITVPFSGIRDGSYTVAAHEVDDRTARMFAAHSSPGLMEAYVQRRPELVKPAAMAVYRHFAPFPPAPNLNTNGDTK